MSETAVTNSKATGGKERMNLSVSVSGKVLRVRRYEGNTYSVVVCPAKDAFSRPSVVELRSKRRFGEVDEMVTVDALLGGYEGKPYAVTDRDTGERRQLVPVNLFLDVIETGD